MIRSILFIILSLYGSWSVYGQANQDQALAQQYFQRGEFEKAAELYEKLFDKNPNVAYYYNNLYQSLIRLKEFEKLEKIVSKLIKKNKDELKYLVDLGYMYGQQGELEKAEAEYRKAINNLDPDERTIRQLANAFIIYRDEDYEIETYLKGNKLLKDNNFFSYELGNAYLKKGDASNAAEQLLNHLAKYPANLQRIKNTLQRSSIKTKLYNEVESQVYGMIQKNPENLNFTELLIWIFIQRKDFESALIQVKALDKRKGENGLRVMQLASTAYEAGYYDDAIKCYQYVIDKGKDNELYLSARKELLKTRKEKLAKTNIYTPEDVNGLRSDYEAFLSQYGKNANTANTIRELAQLEAFYGHHLEAAISLLEDLIQMKSINQRMVAESKLDLGDFYIIKGDVWEATLLYSQVDKAEKDSPLGEDARFRNAKLSYHKGDFEWAQAQLKILKASTSELIANDALNLSIFIIDNLGLDTTLAPMKMYSRAELLLFQNKDDAALITLDSIGNLFPGHNLSDDVLFTKAKIFLRKRAYEKARDLLLNIIKIHGEDLLADDATFMLAEIYEKEFGEKEKAMELYKDLIINYKDSVLVVESRKRFRQLRGDTL